MPSLKRASEFHDSEGLDNSDSESAVSASPSNSRKRPRPSASPSEEEVSDRDTTPLADDALLDESALELHQTQILQDKYAHVVDEVNIAAEHGILEQVDCYNFMCHNHLSVEFGPLTNYIIGKNGSGKSAVMSALTLCLGGKASDTNRGQSLKSFIKQGKESSTIVVRIKNQGDAAYMPADYGKSIIVERHFTKSGSSGFKIKSENGRIVSTKKGELDNITDYFSLQMDNPMNVLSQDMARQFLSTSSSAEKYKFFVKGVQLEQLDQDYRVIEDFVDQMEEKSRNQDQDIRILEHHKNVARKKLEASDRHDSLRDRVHNLRQQMAWTQVEEKEQIRDSVAQELADTNEQISNAQAALGNFDTRLEEVQNEADTAAEHALQADRVVEDARTEKDSVQSEADTKHTEHGDCLTQEREIKTALRNAETRRDQHKANIDAENQRLAELSDGGYARKQSEYEAAKQFAIDARQTYEDHRKGKQQLMDDLQAAEKEEVTAKQQMDEKSDEVKQAESRLLSLQRENGSRQNGFPAKMPSLLRAIQQEQSFSKPPVGPVGNHITLLNPKWASIIEGALGNSLSGFLVDSKRDQEILQQIMSRVGCGCSIFIERGGRIDTSSSEPDSQYQTMARILQIDHPQVQRMLVLQNAIEQSLLIEDLEEATSLLYNGPRMRNVRRCFCIDAKDRRRGVVLTYNKSGDPSQSPANSYQGNPRIKSDAASQIRGQQEVVQDLQSHLVELKQELGAAASRTKACRQAIHDHSRREHDLKLEMQEKEDESERLREVFESGGNETQQVDVLQKLLEDAEEEMNLHRGSLNDCQAAKAEKIQELKLVRRRLAALDEKISQLQLDARVAESERSRVDSRRIDIIAEKNSAIAGITQQEQLVQSLQKKYETALEVLEEFTLKATMVSPQRVPVDEGETRTSLDNKLERLQRDLHNFDSQLGAPREAIAEEAVRTQEKYQEALEQIKQTTYLVGYFKETLQNRKRRWEIFRAHISSRAKAQFTYLLSERSFRGYLLLDHSNRRLDLQVEPDITKQDGAGRNTTTLSGGEKSFSQVCLLLALWEAMGSPIRCLDEFDVYMDHINRKMSIDMLTMAADRSIGRQFVFITPGNKSDIKVGPNVRVVELSDPERGQTTLPFQRR